MTSLKYPLLPDTSPSRVAHDRRQLHSREGGAKRGGAKRRGVAGPGSGWNRGGIWNDLEKRQKERRRRERIKAAEARAQAALQLPVLVPEPEPEPEPVFDEVEEMRKRSEQAARRLFDEADEDGSGFLDQEEIIGLAARLGHKLNGRQARHAMAQMDEDGNGEIDFDEFYAWWVKGDITSGPEAGIDYMQQVRRRRLPAPSRLL